MSLRVFACLCIIMYVVIVVVLVLNFFVAVAVASLCTGFVSTLVVLCLFVVA